MARIVVGIDGSPQAEAALRWALEEGRLRGATVKLVYSVASSLPLIVDAPGFVFAEVEEVLRHEGERVLETALGEVIGDSDPGVPIERELVDAPPAKALLQAAEEADLLVVGSRGRGGFAGLLLGSVSQQCAHHAPCPIVILRGTD